MHSDWKRLALVCAAAALAIYLPSNDSLRRHRDDTAIGVKGNISMGQTAASAGGHETRDIVARITVPAVASNIVVYGRHQVPVCVALPSVRPGSIVFDDGVAVGMYGECMYVPWCNDVDSMTAVDATCSDGSVGYILTAIHTSLTPRWSAFSSVPADRAIVVTATCSGRGYIVDDNNTALAEMWEQPDGSGMFAALGQNALSPSAITSNCVMHGITQSFTRHAVAPCVLDHTTADWHTVSISVVQLRPGVLVVASTWTANSTRVGVVGWYHQPKFEGTLVAAVCGTPVETQTRLAGSMLFANVSCDIRRFSMVLLTGKLPTLFGRHMTISANPVSTCRAVGPADETENSVDMNGVHSIIGDTYYMRIPSRGVEVVVRDTNGKPRALVSPSGGCVVVDGWLPSNEMAGMPSSYTPCSEPASLCYNAISNVTVTSPLTSVAPFRPVAAGGQLFKVPWPPAAAATLGLESTPLGVSRYSLPTVYLTEMCGPVLVHYVSSADPLNATHFSPSGSVSRESLGLVPRMWINASATPELLGTSCGLLQLWRINGMIVASPDPPSALLAGSFRCLATRRCAATGRETFSQEQLLVNSPVGQVYVGGSIQCTLT